jgi:serine phosphatase RsbU (regulator of sigma subunit)/AmiR/NasT family two-component response regulator
MANETVLVVEDEVLVGMELKEDLERLGYRVPDVVASGERVVEAVAAHQPDLVLMDIQLEGGVDGIEAAYQAKAEFEVPIIFLTAYSDRETLRRAAIVEPAAFLLKPFDERELSANVEMALARSKGGESARRDLRQVIPLVKALDAPGILADADGKVLFVNEAAARALRANDAGRLRGIPLSSFVVPAEGRGSRAVRALDGSEAPVRARVMRLDRGDGRFMGSYVSLESLDPKERALLERSAAEANDAIARALPRPESAGSGYRVGGFLNPCPAGTGDCFDVFRIDARRFGFYGLDVIGHGILSSLVAFSLHNLVPVLATGREDGPALAPAEVIRRLNDLYRDFGDRKAAPFFTIAYGTVESYSGEFSVARAGHVPVLHISARGISRFLDAPGAAIGIFEELEIGTVSGVLETGDRLLVASDGLLDVFNEEDPAVARDAFADFVDARKSLGVDDLSEEFYRLDAARRSQQALVDDSSLLVIERS